MLYFFNQLWYFTIFLIDSTKLSNDRGVEFI